MVALRVHLTPLPQRMETREIYTDVVSLEPGTSAEKDRNEDDNITHAADYYPRSSH